MESEIKAGVLTWVYLVLNVKPAEVPMLFPSASGGLCKGPCKQGPLGIDFLNMGP